MTEPLIIEDDVELEAIKWLKEIGYEYKLGYDIAAEGKTPERSDYHIVILKKRLEKSLIKLNPDFPKSSIDIATSQLLNQNISDIVSCNKLTQNWLVKGINVEFEEKGQTIGKQLKLIDYENVENNDWLVVNQYEVQGANRLRRPDTVVFINGLPLSVIEFKNPADEDADIFSAFNQLQTYKNDIPQLFYTNINLVISDYVDARSGSLTSDLSRFSKWRTINGIDIDPLGKFKDLETLLRGFFKKEVFLEYIRYHCCFVKDEKLIKKISAYHQFYAVKHAVENIIKVSKEDGNTKGGVVWHTQGAGKSLEMTCLAGQLLSHKKMNNPTIVVVTDRQDLDGALFDSFVDSKDLLGENPKKALSREDLRVTLNNIPSGGIIFTTIQKFGLEKNETTYPKLSDRTNIVVMCDEAHRSQYGFQGKIDEKSGEIKYGFAKALRDALPNAVFLGFTGTPISREDRDTRAVFGDYVSIYDIKQAVNDGATVPIYYESRLAKLKLKEDAAPIIDGQIEEIFGEDIDDHRYRQSKKKWARLEALVGAKPRLQMIAEDFINHFENRQSTFPGKAMFVSMSRDICARLYDEIIKIKPDWHNDDPMKGKIKVIMTAVASDEAHMQRHHSKKEFKKPLEKRFKNPKDDLQIVIVRDMWLTGFDAPCLTTMYVDKPMKGANLAQAIARVNRVFHDKPGGLIVDYIGIAPQLKEALATYTENSGRGSPTLDSSEALKLLNENISIIEDILHPVDWSNFKNSPLKTLPICLEKILLIKDGKKRFCDLSLIISKSFSLCSTLDEAIKIREKVAFFQAIRAVLIKGDGGKEGKTKKEIDYQLRQLISESVTMDGVEDVFKLAGLDSPDISVMSDEFLRDVLNMPQKNLAVELLQKLLKGEIKSKFKQNVVKEKEFSEMLKNSISKYQNRSIEAAQVIEELIVMARKFKEEIEKGRKLKLNSDEMAFYDALANNESAREAMKDELLVQIAKEVADKLRKNLKIDWSVRESVRASLRIMIKTLLRKYGYPPDGQDSATNLILKQAEVISENWQFN